MYVFLLNFTEQEQRITVADGLCAVLDGTLTNGTITLPAYGSEVLVKNEK
jgi:beta-galactosidase GanA